MAEQIKIGGRLHSIAEGNVVTGANEILDDSKGKKQSVVNQETDAELERLNNAKQDNLTFDTTPTEGSTNPITSGGVYAADEVIQQAIEAILLLIPSAASALNQLADKNFVNSTVATDSATFRGTYNVVTDLELHYDATHQQIATALLSKIQTADNNDYCFVQIPLSDSSGDIRVTERYKFNGTVWSYEYDLNNSGFTAAQWAAINSTITQALVEKLGALPTAAELAIALNGKQNTLTFDTAPVAGSNNPVTSGGLYAAFAAINATIPAAASADNKLVAETRLAEYVAAIINALDATYNVTSTDGHVNVRLTQVDGVITSLEVLTSDIASAADVTSLTTRVSTNEGDIALLQEAYESLTQSTPEIIEPTDTWPVVAPQEGVIYRVIDRVNTPPQNYSDYMYNGTAMVLMATYDNAIDDIPTPSSNNLVKSGGVASHIVYDISEANAVGSTLATYADLAAALGNNGANIPPSIQKGGMSVKFIQSFYNKYKQYRLMSDDFSITESDWQGVDGEPTIGSRNLVESGGVFPTSQKMQSIIDYYIIKGKVFVQRQQSPWDFYTTDNVSCYVTDYIPVSPNDVVQWVHYLDTVLTSAQLLVYNSSKEIIDNFSAGSSPSRICTMPANTAYIRASMSIADMSKTSLQVSANKIFDGSFYVKTISEHVVAIEKTIGQHEDSINALHLYSNSYGKKAVFFLKQEDVVAEAKIGNNIDKIKLSWEGSDFQYYLISYTDSNYSEGRQDTEWKYFPGIEDVADKSLYYVVHIIKKDDTAFTQVELESIDVDAIIAATDYTVTPDGIYVEKAALTFGNSKYKNSSIVFGYDLFNTCKSITISGDTSNYKYYIEGYNDVVMRDSSHLVYETGWQYYPKEFVFENTSLYYVLTIEKRNYANIVESDLSALSVYVTRNFADVFAEKKQGNAYENDINKIPSYYFEGFYLPNKVTTINNLLYGCAAKGDAFIFVTDQHWYNGARRNWNARMSPNLMKYIIDNTSIDKIFDGGDREDGPSNAFTNKCFEILPDKNYFPVLGNHEVITQGSTIDAAYASSFQHLSNKALAVWGTEGELNYYVDNNIHKIRYIFLQSSVKYEEGSQQTVYTKLGFPNDTVSWLQNTALNVESGWTIIVVTHYLAVCDDANKTIMEPPATTYWTENNYYQVMQALKNYNGNGIIACVLHGHTHWDASLVIHGAKNDFPIIVTTSDRLNMTGVGHQEDRVAGTITENAFDVVVLDKDQRKISCVRVGAPAWTDYTQEDWGKAEYREFTY